MLKSIVIAASLLAPSVAAAQLATLNGDIEETFADFVRVSGSLVVGLEFQSQTDAQQNVDLRTLGVFLPQDAGKVCFRAVSKDGYYFASGELAKPNAPAGYYRVREANAWALADQASRYTHEEFAARISLGENCETNRKAALAPVSTGEGNEQLVVSLNSQRALQLSATITMRDDLSVQGDCASLRGSAARAFDSQCLFSLPPDIDGIAELAIRRVPERGPTRVDAVNIQFSKLGSVSP